MSDEISYGTNFAKLLREHRESNARSMHKEINDDLNLHPLIVVDDQDLDKVLMVTLKSSPYRGKSKKSNLKVLGGERIKPWTSELYYVVIGDQSDLERPILSSLDGEILPMAIIDDYVFNHLEKNKKYPPAGELAKVVEECFSSKVNSYPDSTYRPRNISAVFVSNPKEESRLANDEGKIYVLERTHYGDSLTIQEMKQDGKNPAHYASDKSLWNHYQKNLNLLAREKRKPRSRARKGLLNIDDKITASIASLMAMPRVKSISPSLIDVVTVPFEPPEGNRSNARYDSEYLEPLFERAGKLRSKYSKM